MRAARSAGFRRAWRPGRRAFGAAVGQFVAVPAADVAAPGGRYSRRACAGTPRIKRATREPAVTSQSIAPPLMCVLAKAPVAASADAELAPLLRHNLCLPADPRCELSVRGGASRATSSAVQPCPPGSGMPSVRPLQPDGGRGAADLAGHLFIRGGAQQLWLLLRPRGPGQRPGHTAPGPTQGLSACAARPAWAAGACPAARPRSSARRPAGAGACPRWRSARDAQRHAAEPDRLAAHSPPGPERPHSCREWRGPVAPRPAPSCPLAVEGAAAGPGDVPVRQPVTTTSQSRYGRLARSPRLRRGGRTGRTAA